MLIINVSKLFIVGQNNNDMVIYSIKGRKLVNLCKIIQIGVK